MFNQLFDIVCVKIKVIINPRLSFVNIKIKKTDVKKFVIERNLPGASNLSTEELRGISQTFCEAANKIGTPYTWVQSFITDDKIYCVHIAASREAIREHSRIAKFPINTISEVATTIYPGACDV